MAEENVMAIQQWQDQEAHQSLLRLMRISNEFDMMKESMEMFPLPGNRVERQIGDNMGFERHANAKDFGRGMRATDLLTSFSLSTDITQHKIKELAENAKQELTKLLVEGEPLWQHDIDKGFEVLNKAEYVRRFDTNLEMTLEEIIKIIAVDAPLDLCDLDGTTINNTDRPSSEQGFAMQDDDVNQPGPRATQVGQASRYMGYVQMPAICLVEVLMDVRLWSFVFSEMLSRAVVLGVLAPGAQGTHDGALLVMTSECHVPSPFLPTWQSCFARHCKEISPNMWLIVDISLESMIDNPLMNCRRRPSGCLVQGLLDGNTAQITWIEHTEAELPFIHPLLKSVVDSGPLFSARQWADTLIRQCQRLNYVMQPSPYDLNKEVRSFRVESLLRLAGRMRREFYGAVSATTGNDYKPMSIAGRDDILLKTLESDDQAPNVFTVTTLTWFLFTRKKVFSFLGNDENRSKWDILALEHEIQELFHVHSGPDPEDIVSITKLVDANTRVDTFFIQDKHQTEIASYVILSPITYDSIASLSSHGNIDEIPLLPSGFAILSNKQVGQEEGSIVTLSFQLLDSSQRGQHLSIRTTRKLLNLVIDTISLIRTALFEVHINPNQDDTEGCSCVKRNKQINETKEVTQVSGINVIKDVEHENCGTYIVQHVED